MTTSDHVHRHGQSCYWDHLRCGWVCAPARPAPQPEPEPDRELTPPTEPVPTVR